LPGGLKFRKCARLLLSQALLIAINFLPFNLIMEVLNIAFHLVSFLLAFLAAFLLLWVNRERKHSNRLLAFVLVIFAFQNLVLILLFSRLILEIPWLLRVFAPTTFLVGPAAFVYIRSVLNDELKFRKYDWLLLIPAILAMINFIPYYLLPINEKINFLNNSFYNNVHRPDSGRGLLPGSIYYVIRICWSAIFIFIGYRLIYLFRGKNTSELVAKNKILLNWLFTFNSMLTAVLIVAILKTFIPTLKNTQLTIADILLGATILFICLQLFVRPQILYGVFQPLQNFNISNEIPPAQDILLHQTESMAVSADHYIAGNPRKETTTFSTEQEERYKNLIENCFQRKKPFLQPDYSLKQLVADTNIPRYILSAFINREYGMGFREFLNRYRIEYLIGNLDRPEWKQFTLEAIATECGFSSRTTFIKNFKEITGQTPTEYVKNGQLQSLS
jgi:AraC-like DNA-binding protein